MPVELAAVTHAATLDMRLAASQARIARSEHSGREIERATQAIRDRLADAASSRVRFSRAELGSAGTYALRHLWEAGEVLGYDASGSPAHKARAFVRADQLDGWAIPSVTSARRELTRRYVRAYGPVSVRDLAWWTGWGIVKATRVIQDMRSELLEVLVEGLPGTLFLHSADEPLARGVTRPSPEARVLAYEDPEIKAYRETRGRYLASCPPFRLFWHAGEALACVTIGGRVAATWGWRAPRTMSWNAVRDLTSEERDLIDARLTSTASWLRSWTYGAARSRSRSR